MNFTTLENNFKEITKYKKYILIYLAFVVIFSFAMLCTRNFDNPKFEIISILAISVLGIFLVPYILKNEENLPKVVFLLILIFGVMMIILSPPMNFPDEAIHYTRAEYITEGVLQPHGSSQGFYIDNYYFPLNHPSTETTILNDRYLEYGIHDHKGYWSYTTSTPFYTYLFAAAGIFVGKILGLLAVGALWLGRLGNLLFYGGVSYIAVKKAPKYKVPLAVIACFPLSVAIASSLSYDCFIIGATLISIAYFVKMLSTEVETKDLIIFLGSCLLVSLVKQPYFLFAFLLLIVPKENFKSEKVRKLSQIGLIAFLILIVLSIATRIPTLMNIFNFNAHNATPVSVVDAVPGENVSVTGQMMYLISHPIMILNIFLISIKTVFNVFIRDLYVYHFGGFKGSKGFNLFYFVFFIVFSLLYQHEVDLSKKKRGFILLLFLMMYVGMFFVLYLIWNPIGSSEVLGIQARYFLPILTLIPMILMVNKNCLSKIKLPKFLEKELKNKDLWILTFIMIFLLGLVLLTITHYY